MPQIDRTIVSPASVLASNAGAPRRTGCRNSEVADVYSRAEVGSKIRIPAFTFANVNDGIFIKQAGWILADKIRRSRSGSVAVASPLGNSNVDCDISRYEKTCLNPGEQSY